MNPLVNVEITNSQIALRGAENLVYSSKVFSKRFFKQINDTEIPYCNISFSNFANVLEFEITNFAGNEFSEQVVFTLEYANVFSVELKLNGYWELEQELGFRITDVDWTFAEKEDTPTSAFALETLKAILFLSNDVKVEIPVINYWFQVSISQPLNKISEILQNRRLAYQLLIIERAFQTSLHFPPRFIEAREIADIYFCYKAVIAKEFELPGSSVTILLPALEENKKYLPVENIGHHIVFPTSNEEKVIFNHRFSLGRFQVEIEQAIIENYEEVKAKFAQLNGQSVQVIIKPLNGKLKYIAADAPTFQKAAWEAEIQKLIDLDEQLNSVFLARYFKIAASTLDGLSEAQQESITERPKLAIKSFE